MLRTSIGRFPVRTDVSAVERFRAALGTTAHVGRQVPYTFPIVWMNAPSVRSAVERHLNAQGYRAGAILMHVAQSVSYGAPLQPERDYVLSVDLAIEPGTEQTALEAIVADGSGQEICRLESRIALLRPRDDQ